MSIWKIKHTFEFETILQKRIYFYLGQSVLLRLPVVLALDRRVFVADLFPDGIGDILKKA